LDTGWIIDASKCKVILLLPLNAVRRSKSMY
jgi:hypothetical protein